MKNRYIFIYLMLLSAVFACERVEEINQPDQEQNAVEKVAMTFSAVIESEMTKTALVEGEENGVKKVVWQPGDAIAVSPYLTMQASLPSEYWKDGKIQTPVKKFVSTLATSDAESEFEGKVEIAASYKAFYPYSETIIDWGDSIYFDIPDVQKYVNGTFDPQAAPMVATASYGQTFDFQNLCGILAFKLVGTESVKSLTFSATDYYDSPMSLAGRYSLNTSSLDYKISPSTNLKYAVTLSSDNPVQLDPVTPTMFYLMLPPGTYQTFTLTIATEEGVMIRIGKNPITLERSHLKPTGVLEYVETVEVDLSERGNANCYIVTEPGFYSFDATVIGNGEYGFVDGVDFHVSTPEISPASVDLIWEDRNGLIRDVKLNETKDRVKFTATGIEGNALVAVKDASENILWSWHIWVTDNPAEQIYNTNQGQRFVVMDRNLGSISAVMGEAGGSLYYQWGRKDPFRLNEMYELVKTNSNPFLYVTESIAAPTTHPTGGDYWVLNHSPQFWSKSVKTIYDPCPVGWKVPGSEIWSGMRTLLDCDGQENRAYAYGVVFGFADSDHFWYPDTPRFDSTGAREGGYTDDSTELWTAEDGISCFLNYGSNYTQTRSRMDSYPVRCMKEE